MTAIVASRVCADSFAGTTYDRRYTLTYQAKGAATSAGSSGFEIIARPNPYGVGGLRSFYLDESGVIRPTAQDGSPTAQDPPIQ